MGTKYLSDLSSPALPLLRISQRPAYEEGDVVHPLRGKGRASAGGKAGAEAQHSLGAAANGAKRKATVRRSALRGAFFSPEKKEVEPLKIWVLWEFR